MVALASKSSAHEEVDERGMCSSSQPQLTEQDPASENQKGGGVVGRHGPDRYSVVPSVLLLQGTGVWSPAPHPAPHTHRHSRGSAVLSWPHGHMHSCAYPPPCIDTQN